MPEASARRLPATRAVVFGLAVLFLFLGFYGNAWSVSDPHEFQNRLRDTESLVLGRLVKSRADGVFSAGGLTGAGIPTDIHRDWITEEQIGDQHSAFIEGAGFDEFSPYLSQTGGQGMVFGLLDRLLPLAPVDTLRLFYGLTALTSALVLGLIVLWFFGEFGFVAAGVVLCSLLFSDWLTLFGRSLWWSLWAFYLPMVGVMFYLRRGGARSSGAVGLGLLAFALMTVKCFINGYEFISTTAVMMVVPLVYYDAMRRSEIADFLRRATAMAVGTVAAVGASLTVLSVQIAHALDGSALDGWRHIGYSLGKRTYGRSGDQYSETVNTSLDTGVFEVLTAYLTGVYVDTSQFVSASGLREFARLLELEVGYAHLLALFAVASVAALAVSGWVAPGQVRSKHGALVLATWASIAAPMSWYVLFKGHAAVHLHLDYLLWQMPFTLFGFAVVGVAFGEMCALALRQGGVLNAPALASAEGRLVESRAGPPA